MPLSPGDVLEGKYRIVRLLGEGGMGSVFEGENLRIRRRVAIKILHAGVAENEEIVRRFEREAQVAGQVGNDHILEILDLGTLSTGEHFMVMEYLDGQTFTERIRSSGRLTPAEAVPIIRQVLVGLDAAHAVGIVHRDLKPDNVIIMRQKGGHADFVKIIDFGISKFKDSNDGLRMTRTGALLGSPFYMSPEQASGSSEVDPRTDLYAVGVMLYEGVTGRVPFEADTFNKLLFEIALAQIIPPKSVVPTLDDGIDSIINKATARDPNHRFQTAEQFMKALDQWAASGTPVSVPPQQALESIVAATVPRAATGAHRVVPGGDTLAAPPAPTVNTWASSQAGAVTGVGQKSLALWSAVGVGMFAASAIGGYLVLRHPAPAPAIASSASSAQTPVATATVPTQNPTVAPPSEEPKASASTAPSVAPVVAVATAAPAVATVTPHFQAKTPHPTAAKPPAETKKEPPKQTAGAKPFNFGY